MTNAPPAIRRFLFWIGCTAISAGVALHLPMLLTAHEMRMQFSAMPMSMEMVIGMALILSGAALAIAGAIPPMMAQHSSQAATMFEASDATPLNRWHALVLAVLTLGLVIDVMKPATLGFVLPGMRNEYDLPGASAAWLPFVALSGTAIGSFVWGWLADRHGRRTSILLSTILFVSTSICGAMPAFQWNLVMCFLMGCSAGGMLPVVYTLLAEIMPPRHRSWVLVLVGGVGMVGGYLAASLAAHQLEPVFGWRILWLQGFPSGIALLLLARWIPESPRFLLEQGRHDEVVLMERRFGIARRDPRLEAIDPAPVPARQGRLTLALIVVAMAWSFVNFGLLLWLPSDLAARGYSVAVASGIISKSALLALPTIGLVALLYSCWSSKWTLVATVAATLAGLLGALAPPSLLATEPALVTVIGLLVIGTNGMIAVLLPYAAENYPLGIRGRATGAVAGASKVGGVAIQGFALAGFIPTLAGAGAALVAPMAAAGVLLAIAGRETRGRSLRDLESSA